MKSRYRKRIERWLIRSLLLTSLVTLPLRSSSASDAERRAAADKALTYLSEKLRTEGLSHPSGNNGHVVVYATAGLAFLASGSTLSQGCYQADLVRCVNYVNKHAGIDEWGEKQWDQTTWGLAHAVIFFAHLHRKSTPPQQMKLSGASRRCVDLLVASQTESGGWCHGQHDVANALNYKDLVATTNIALFGLGLARQQGVEVPNTTIESAAKYILASSDGKGRVGYSPRKGQRGFAEPGRNAAALLALQSIGSEDRDEFSLMTRYFRETVGDELNRGHGSAQLALLQAAWASQLLGEDHWQRYWTRLGHSILARQRTSGAFSPPEGDKSLSEAGDRATATHALILLLPEGRLSAVK